MPELWEIKIYKRIADFFEVEEPTKAVFALNKFNPSKRLKSLKWYHILKAAECRLQCNKRFEVV
jgi:hypothetical protein